MRGLRKNFLLGLGLALSLVSFGSNAETNACPRLLAGVYSVTYKNTPLGDGYRPARNDPSYQTFEMNPKYRGEDEGKVFLHGKNWKVHYLDPVERDQARVTIRNGKLCDAYGNPLKGLSQKRRKTYLYAMDASGNIFLSDRVTQIGQFHHSSFLDSQPVAAAGTLTMLGDKIVMVSNDSGHYHPPTQAIAQFMDQLRFEGVDTSSIEIKDFTRH